ncbi:class I SAM-dependent methyltransferase [Caenimonas sedimenti]|uniref:Class I SAM-dependent methyltransferase n=1 Tax=Caenimonas sedimenti TaxID=2596921 RepID=A0A562ZWA3_9BURK|nr:class I SAM-dependent methyltransferase [Caenimonas sedimenti]TWO72899.1 class I SAM-dependent methyltransferase [Caenimonas sedimenti]
MSSALVASLVDTGRWLRQQGYRFVTPTPATHARVLRRDPTAAARNLRDAFGWSRPFRPGLVPSRLLEALRSAQLVVPLPDGLLASRARFSTLGDLLLAHSAYPTTQPDAVFFGPDTYRFAALVESELQRLALVQGARILDVGCGSGAGGLLVAWSSRATGPQVMLTDINASALEFAKANATLAAVEGVSFAQGDLYACVAGEFDLILANPPYLNDGAARTYRHGGGAWGGALSERIVHEGLPRLRPGGRLVLYTGAAIVAGEDPLRDALKPALEDRGWPWSWRELDPDVFGEELEEPAYAGAERIAAVALVVQRPAR